MHDRSAAVYLTFGRDLRMMRKKLIELGYDVPTRSYGFGDPEDSAKKAQDANGNSQTQGSSIPICPDAFLAGAHIEYEANCRSANRSTQYSLSSPRKRKRDEHQMSIDDHRESGLYRPKRLSSRDEMPPPPVQRPPRREPQQNVQSTPKTRTPQNREVYERPPVTPTLRDTFQDLSMRHARPSQPSEDRSQDWETHPYFDSRTNGQPRHDYEHDSNHRHADNRPMKFGDEEQHLEYADPMYAHGPRSSQDHQTFAAHDEAPRGMLQENIRPNYSERPQPSSLSQDTQQYQQRQMRRPLRPVQVDQSGLHTSMRSPYITAGPKANISPLKAGPPTAGSISSPFFQRGVNAPRIAPTHRPPSRAGNGGFMHEQFGQRDPPREGTGYSIRHKEPVTRGNIFGPKNGQQFSNRLPSSSGYKSFEQAPSSSTLSYGGPTATSQAPSESRGPYRTRDHGPSLQYPIASKQTMTSPRGHITLPPSTSGTQDHGLANMKGVRGGFPHRAEGVSASQYSGFSDSRPLFAPVSRRSVRR
jgi:hypothetical protein